MAVRELLSEFGIGIDLSQVVAADGALRQLQGVGARVGQALGAVGGKSLKVDVDGGGLSSLTSLTDLAKESLLSFFSVQGAKKLAGEFSALIDEGGKLNDLSEKLGVGSEDLQRFAYATGQSGVEADSAYAALGKLQKALGEGLGGGAPAKDFAALGIELRDSSKQTRPLLDIASQLADKVKEAGSEAEGAAILTKAFGKSGAALLPAFKAGGAALSALGDEVDDLGGLMSQDFVKAADDVGDDLMRIKVASKGAAIQLASQLLPSVREGVTWLVKMAKAAVKLNKETNVLKASAMTLASGGVAFLTIRLIALAKAYAGVEGPGKSATDVVKGLFSFGVTGTALVLGVVLLGLLFEDLYTLMTGGKSALGDFLDKTYGIGASTILVNELKDSWAGLDEVLASGGFEGVEGQLKALASGTINLALEKFAMLARGVGQIVTFGTQAIKVLQALGEAASAIKPSEALMNLLGGGGPSSIVGAEGQGALTKAATARDAGKAALSKLQDLVVNPNANGDLKGKAAQANQALVNTSETRRGGALGGDTQVTQTIKADIQVVGATTNEGTGAAVTKAVGQGLENAALAAASAAVRK